MSNNQLRNREAELDLLRILAMLAVICVHGNYGELPEGQQRIRIFLTSLMTWQVPVFVMISGRFFLDPDKAVTFRSVRRAILRLTAAFLFWNPVYQLYFYFSGAYANLNWKGILSQAVLGPYHFWFLFMLAGLYLITPFLRQIVKSKRLTEYYLLLFLLFEGLSSYGAALPYIGTMVESMLGKIQVRFVLGFSGYFVLGYYLKRYPPSGKKEILLYCLALICMIGGGILTLKEFDQTQMHNEWLVQYLRPNIVIVAAGIYTLFIRRIHIPKKATAKLRFLAQNCFGVYLIHALLLELLRISGISFGSLPILVSVPLVVLGIFCICQVLTTLLKRIPFIRKTVL